MCYAGKSTLCLIIYVSDVNVALPGAYYAIILAPVSNVVMTYRYDRMNVLQIFF